MAKQRLAEFFLQGNEVKSSSFHREKWLCTFREKMWGLHEAETTQMDLQKKSERTLVRKK